MPNYQRPPLRSTGARSSAPQRGGAANHASTVRRQSGTSATRRTSQSEQGGAATSPSESENSMADSDSADTACNEVGKSLFENEWLTVHKHI